MSGLASLYDNNKKNIPRGPKKSTPVWFNVDKK